MLRYGRMYPTVQVECTYCLPDPVQRSGFCPKLLQGWVYKMIRKTVLVIEDNPGDRTIYGNMLWYNGFDVVFAEDGETGLRLAQELRPDLVLLDLQLPLLHGSEISSQLKQDDATKKIPIVALTGRRLIDFGGNAQVLGYERFLEKPISPLEVLRVVEEIIGRAAYDQMENLRRPELMPMPADRKAALAGAGASGETQAIAQSLIDNAGQVLELWQKAAAEEPWFTLPRTDRSGFLQELVVALAEAAVLMPNDRDACRKVVVAAAAHGRARREQEIPETSIPTEFHLLRQAVGRYVLQTFAPSEASSSAIIAFDAAISLGLNACMWGYFREEIEAQGLWETAVDRLVDSACQASNQVIAVDADRQRVVAAENAELRGSRAAPEE
jgi:two-component system cell cycle response regulator DivK